MLRDRVNVAPRDARAAVASSDITVLILARDGADVIGSRVAAIEQQGRGLIISL